MSHVSEDSFGVLWDDLRRASVPVRRFTLTNVKGVRAQLIDYGATLTALHAPDRAGQLADVTLGFDNMDGLNFSYFLTFFLLQKVIRRKRFHYLFKNCVYTNTKIE